MVRTAGPQLSRHLLDCEKRHDRSPEQPPACRLAAAKGNNRAGGIPETERNPRGLAQGRQEERCGRRHYLRRRIAVGRRSGESRAHYRMEQRTNRGTGGQAENAEAPDLRAQQLRPSQAPHAPRRLNHASCGRAVKAGEGHLWPVAIIWRCVLKPAAITPPRSPTVGFGSAVAKSRPPPMPGGSQGCGVSPRTAALPEAPKRRLSRRKSPTPARLPGPRAPMRS